MILTRRDFVAGCAAGAFLPAAACRAAEAGTLFTPEAFGAVGDGAADDYEAFQRLASAVSSAGGGMVTLRPGRTYLLDRFIRPNNGVSDVIFSGCSGLMIEGNGATIATKGDFFRDAATTRGLSGLRFEDCNSVTVSNLQLVGNVQLTRRPSGLSEAPTHGLNVASCSDVIVDGVTARHFAADGLCISASARRDSSGRLRASRRFSVRNSRFLFNARQGLTVSQLRDAVFDNCDFSGSGYIDSSSNTGAYGHHAPAAGIDIEPDRAPFTPQPTDVLTGNLTIRNCRMIGNFGAALSAVQISQGRSTIENLTVQDCTMEASEASTSPYGLFFDVPGGVISGCTIKMYDKTAFLGWYQQSAANPAFRGNIVSGMGRGGRPMLVVRRTRGAPVIEGNRFLGQVRIDNPDAVVRDNQSLERT